MSNTTTSSKKLKLKEQQSIANNAVDSLNYLNKQIQQNYKSLKDSVFSNSNMSNLNIYKTRVSNSLQENKVAILIGLLSIFLTIILIILFSLSQREKQTNKYLNILTDYSDIISIFIGIGFVFCILYFVYYFSNNNKPISLTLRNIGFGFGIIIGFSLLLYLIYFVSMSYNNFSFISFFINIGLVVFSLYMANFILSIILPQSPYLTLIRSSLFLIPCFIIDYIIYPIINFTLNVENKYEYKYLILLIFQILFIVLYFYYDKLLEMIYTYNGKLLLGTPKYLDQEYTIGNYENLVDIISSNEKQTNTLNKFNYNYGLQAWIYIDDQPSKNSTTEYVPLLRYGKNPIISYNVDKHSLRVSIKDEKDNIKIIYQTQEIPLQTWNHFVINYDNGNIDIFINNILVSTSISTIPYMQYDSVISGYSNGVSGGITNVVYFKSPMSKTMIDLYYRIFRYSKIPSISTK